MIVILVTNANAIKIETHTSNKVQTKMMLGLSSKIHWEAIENGFLIDSSSRDPSIEIISANFVLQLMGKLPVMHPLFGVSPSNPPLFQSCSSRL